MMDFFLKRQAVKRPVIASRRLQSVWCTRKKTDEVCRQANIGFPLRRVIFLLAQKVSVINASRGYEYIYIYSFSIRSTVALVK